jgi:plastocyanin
MRVLLVILTLLMAAPRASRAGSLEVRVQDTEGAPVADAVVCVYSGEPRAAVPVTSVDITQQDREFVPRVTVLAVGSTARFPNQDTVAHHVYSFSSAKTFDLPLYTGAPPAGVVFDRPGIVAIGCNIHDWMLAHIYVTDAPWFGLTDSNGVYRLDGMTAGIATTRVWHARLRGPAPERAVGAGAAVATFELPLRPESRRRGAPRVGGGGGYR